MRGLQATAVCSLAGRARGTATLPWPASMSRFEDAIEQLRRAHEALGAEEGIPDKSEKEMQDDIDRDTNGCEEV